MKVRFYIVGDKEWQMKELQDQIDWAISYYKRHKATDISNVDIKVRQVENNMFLFNSEISRYQRCDGKYTLLGELVSRKKVVDYVSENMRRYEVDIDQAHDTPMHIPQLRKIKESEL